MVRGKSPLHAAFIADFIFIFLLLNQRLYIIYIYIYIYVCVCVCVCVCVSGCVQFVYELPLLPNNTAVKHFYTNREQCEVLTGYLSLGRRPGGDWANT